LKLSHKLKLQFKRWCIQRDGDNCYLCQKPLGQTYVIESLNNNSKDARLENSALAHQHCNISKIHNTDYQILAREKLQTNETALFIPLEDDTPDNASTEIKISKNNFEITEQNISEKILVDKKISWNDALYGSVYKCKKLTGYGSPQCVRNYLKVLTSCEAPFMCIKDEFKNKIIVVRNQN